MTKEKWLKTTLNFFRVISQTLPNHHYRKRSLLLTCFLGLASFFKSKNYSVDNQKITNFELLRKFSFLCARTGANIEYNEALIKYDTSININNYLSSISKSYFVGSGRSPSSLNSYRHVLCDESSYFEKIYEKGSQEEKNLRLFCQDAANKIQNSGIKVVDLKQIITGEKITIALFEYKNNPRISKKNVEATVLDCCSKLAALNLHESNINDIPNDFTKDKYYQSGKKHVFSYHKNGKSLNNSIEKIESNILQSAPLVAGHGDLHAKNILSDGTILDWDSFGLYPIGYDLAHFYSKHAIFKSPAKMEDFCLTIAKQHFPSKERPKFIYAFFFFLLIFYSQKRNVSYDFFAHCLDTLNHYK